MQTKDEDQLIDERAGVSSKNIDRADWKDREVDRQELTKLNSSDPLHLTAATLLDFATDPYSQFSVFRNSLAMTFD